MSKQQTIWQGRHLAVEKYPGETYYGGSMQGTAYSKVEFVLVDRPGLAQHNARSDALRQVIRHLLKKEPERRFSLQGRQTKAQLQVFIDQARALDEQWENLLAAVQEEKRLEAVRRARESDEHQRRQRIHLAAEDLLIAAEQVDAQYDQLCGVHPAIRPALDCLRAAIRKARGND